MRIFRRKRSFAITRVKRNEETETALRIRYTAGHFTFTTETLLKSDVAFEFLHSQSHRLTASSPNSLVAHGSLSHMKPSKHCTSSFIFDFQKGSPRSSDFSIQPRKLFGLLNPRSSTQKIFSKFLPSCLSWYPRITSSRLLKHICYPSVPQSSPSYYLSIRNSVTSFAPKSPTHSDPKQPP